MPDNFKVGVEQISNGWVIFGPDGKTYREKPDLVAKELQVAVDAYKKELLNPTPQPKA
jgi:hypothetical protein